MRYIGGPFGRRLIDLVAARVAGIDRSLDIAAGAGTDLDDRADRRVEHAKPRHFVDRLTCRARLSRRGSIDVVTDRQSRLGRGRYRVLEWNVIGDVSPIMSALARNLDTDGRKGHPRR